MDPIGAAVVRRWLRLCAPPPHVIYTSLEFGARQQHVRRLTSDDEALSLTWRDGSKTTGRTGGGIAVQQIFGGEQWFNWRCAARFRQRWRCIRLIYLFGLFQMVWFRE